MEITCPPQRDYARLVLVENVFTNTDLADNSVVVDVF